MSGRFVLRARQVATAGGLRPADVLVAGGRIVEVADRGAFGEGSGAPGLPVEDLGELALLPGMVDLHVHVDEPGRTEWEGFAHATRAAAAGGITTLVDMPLNSSPVTTTVAALDEKRRAALGQCFVDVAFHGGLVPDNARDPTALGALLAAGIVGVKAFLCESGLAEFAPVSHADLAAAMPVIAEAGLPLLVHAERVVQAERTVGVAPPLPSARYADYLASRPASMERAAIDEVIALARTTGCRVHVVHLATAEAAPALRAAKVEGLPITVETCPHYLTFAAEEIADGDTRFQCAPPIRDRVNRDGLWRALEDGTIDLVASDHSPCPPELKGRCPPGEPGRWQGRFGEAWGGIASLQVSVAATWTGLRARGGGLELLVEKMATRPADLLGLARKGRIAAGADADLVAFDAGASFVVDGAQLRHRHPLTPYQGRTLVGIARRAWLRGVPVETDRAAGGEPRGRLLARGEA